MAVLIFGYVVLMSSVCVDFVFSGSKSCTLKVFEAQSGDHVKDLCTEEFESKDKSVTQNQRDCTPFLKHFNRSDLPAGFPLSDEDDPVQRPESLDLTPTMNQKHRNGAEYFVPAAYVNWSSPVAST
ncbi:hypothetical protein RRG08_067106 [Elysia crispata]|uniref:Uncharacterized protein n=1 Tax=Elysia crispata TaxID=231223 RepID=A0AAE1B8C6_9GAST|nr:hypothetical protein RRG08_067106 [Elysia crispata]